MIQIRAIRGREEVFLNGEHLKNVEVMDGNSVIEVEDRDALNQLGKCTFADLNDVDVVEIRQLFKLSALRSVCIMAPFDYAGGVQRYFTVEYFFETSLLEWNNLYPFVDYINELKRISKSRIPRVKCLVEGSVYDGDYSLIVKFPVRNPASQIGSKIEAA